MKDLLIVGAGDFGKEVAWIAEIINRDSEKYRVLGYLDDDIKKHGTELYGYRVLGGTELLNDVYKDSYAIIAMQDGRAREKISERLTEFQNWETVIHPNAIINKTVKLGKGCIIAANVIVSIDTEIGDHVCINNDSYIGHDCVLKSYSSIMGNVAVSGHCKLEEGAYLGSGSTIIPFMEIGEFAKVGAGATVMSHVKEHITVVGNPARNFTVKTDRGGAN